jgi:hypothetical protein
MRRTVPGFFTRATAIFSRLLASSGVAHRTSGVSKVGGCQRRKASITSANPDTDFGVPTPGRLTIAVCTPASANWR